MKTLRPQKSIAGHPLSNAAVKALLGAAAFGAGLALTLLAAAPAQAATGNPEAAKAKVAMCIGCHGIPGYQASFPEVHKVPMIAGQSAAYLAAALTAYQKGDRKHPTMKGIAASLSEQDILDLSAYYEALGKNLPSKAGHCGLCHYDFNGGGPRNPYGISLEAVAQANGLDVGMKNDRPLIIALADGMDPDGDGFACAWDPRPFRLQ